MRQNWALAGFALALWAATGCSPRFEWREVRSADGFVAVLPGRPQTVSRDVQLAGGERIPMTVVSSGTGSTLFSIGSAQLTAGLASDAGARQGVVNFFRDALVHNIAGTIVARSAAPLPMPAGDPRRLLAAEAIEATGQAGTDGRKSRLAARFYVVDDRFFQLVALGAEGQIPPEALDTFFTSFRLTP